MKNNKRGFTLVEIVMVLVLLGILAAVAVPKYYDLKAKAEQQTALAVLAEYQARLNGQFASNLLDGTMDCKEARKDAIGKLSSFSDEGHGYTIENLTAEAKDTTTVTIKRNGTPVEGTFKVVVPKCSGE